MLLAYLRDAAFRKKEMNEGNKRHYHRRLRQIAGEIEAKTFQYRCYRLLLHKLCQRKKGNE